MRLTYKPVEIWNKLNIKNMEILKRIFTFTLVTIACSFASQAITIDEFIAQCDSIYETPAIKLSGDYVQEMQQEKVEQLTIFQCDSMSEKAKSKLLDALNSISATEDMLVVKHNNEENGNATVYIHPSNDKVKLLVTFILKNKCYVVNLVGDIALLNKSNLVNIGGKDIIKEALKKKEQKQELTE